ncbi:hypothetical protein ACEPAI_5328 [Sanghuangporus weigelae]
MDPFRSSFRDSDSLTQNVRSTLTVPEFLPPNISEKEPTNLDAVSTPRNRSRSRSISQFASSLISPSNEKPSVDVSGISNLNSNSSIKPDKALQETRKLLGHILHELQNRPRPPSAWDAFHPSYGAQRTRSLPLNFKSGLKLRPGHASRSGSLSLVDSDSDDEVDATFSPDLTYELLSKLRDVLVIAKLKNWQIFDDGSGNDESNLEWSEKPTGFRFRRSSFNTGGRRARSSSPNRSKRPSSGLFTYLIVILNSIVLEDCRFQIKSIRLSRPPNALQAVTLDVCSILAYMHRTNAKILYNIGLAAIPAFCTFPKSTHKRLLRFFEDGLLRMMLVNLRGQRNGVFDSQQVPLNQDDRDDPDETPVVAIQVDEAQDETFDDLASLQNWKRWLPPNSGYQGVVSTYAPAQSMEIYYLSSLIAPLMTAILDNVDLLTQDAVLSHRLQAFFCFLADYKPDTSLDLLQVIAYHTDRTRRYAIALLLTYWPKSFGHLSVAKPFPILTHTESLEKTGLIRVRQHEAHPHFHQFMPWHFNPIPGSALFEGSSIHDCHSCLKQITDFGLLCPFCMCAVHFNCYDAPDGNQLSHYPNSDEASTQRVAVHRYSYVRPERSGFESAVARKGQHVFRPVTLFTLSLCGICSLPLWGYIAQGYRCATCNQYVHASCLHGEALDRLPTCYSEPDTSRITINWSDLRASFINFYQEVLLQEEEILRCTFEELSIFWSLLWMQLQLLKYGIASGSIIIVRDRSTSVDGQTGVDNFELQHLEKLYHAYLVSDRLQPSPILQDLLQQSKYTRQSRLLLFDWPTLLYVASVAKSPIPKHDGSGEESLLAVTPSLEDVVQRNPDVHPAEIVSVAQLRDALGQQFGLQRPQAACIMLSHLRHIGFFHSMDIPDGFFTSYEKPSEKLCIFPLPLGLDISTNVEFLIAAVEACFEDLDISVNEAGFLLLVRKLWPNGMFSDYALARLIRAVLAWILSEDDNLVIILREYVAKNINLPGVPSAAENYAWPNKNPSRSTSSGSVNNGNDYVACRKTLLEKYATRWLFAIHCQDPDMYAAVVFKTVTDLAMDTLDVVTSMTSGDKEPLSLCADKVLRSILKLCQSSVAFSTVDDLFLKWLMLFPSTLPSRKPLSTLPRLFNRDSEGTARWTTAFDATITSFEHISAPLLDPWRVVIDVAARDYDGLKKGLDWLCIFAASGVDVPVNTFLQLSALTRDLDAPFEDHLKLAEATFMAIWIKALGRQELHQMISDLHDRTAKHILAQLAVGTDVEKIYRFFRLTFSSFLLLFGCDRSRLEDLRLIDAGDIENLNRRKAVKRASLVEEPNVEDIDFIELLLPYMEEGTDELRCLIMKFLACFLLFDAAWRAYDMQVSDTNDLRTALLVRILVADSRQFEEVVMDYFNEDWEARFSAATKLFQIILDVSRPSFSAEGRQWRTSVMQIFLRFFSCMWSSDREEIRQAVDAWAQSLQVVHQQSMTQCFNEFINRAPICDRIELVSFLLQLRSHFPTWRVLAWDVIIETLMDDEFMQRTDADESAIAAHLSMYGITTKRSGETNGTKDPDVSTLQSSLLLLSLQMIADGVPIDTFSYLKIKMQLVAVCGFPGSTLVPAPSGHSFHVQFGELKSLNPGALPCLQGLMSLLDAYRLFNLAPSAMTSSGTEDDATYPVIVGSVVLDVFLGLFQYLLDNIIDFPYPQIKIMLQSLIITIYKHDVEVAPLRYLREVVRKTVKRVSVLLLKDIGNESKQLVFTAIQAYRKRWLNYASTRDLLVNHVSDIINFVSSSTSAKEDFLIGHAMSVLEDIFTMHSGTFYNLSKQPLPEETFHALHLVMARNTRNIDVQASLPDVVLKDTLHYLVSMQNDPERKTILDNFRKYIEIVHHQGYSPDSLSFVGESFVAVLRSASEFSDEMFDPSPLLLSIATLIQYNKAQVRGLLHHLESALRITLVRFDVSEQALRRLLQVTSTLYRRAATDPATSSQERNIILMVVLEILSEGLRSKCRVTASTLSAMIFALCKPGLNFISSSTLSRLGNDAMFFLQSSTSDFQAHHSLLVSQAASLLVIHAETRNKGLLYRYLGENSHERNGRHSLSVRAWNALALESLQIGTEGNPAIQLFETFSMFSATYHTSLRAHSLTLGLPPDMTSSEINQAFVAIKLWLLLARKCSEEAQGIDSDAVLSTINYASEDRNASLVWNELWPPFERLVFLSETDAELGDLTPIATLVWSSIADILLFLRSMRSSISLESASHIETLNRVKSLAKNESSSSKFTRTLKSLSEPPPELPMTSLIAQATQELVAAEKLHALETRRELGRMLPDRSRRDLRLPTG